jgi:hypothetical protein
MLYDLPRLASYVRFYLTVVTELGVAWENLARTHTTAKEALDPFASALELLSAPALTAALAPAPAPAPGEAFAELFQPVDAAGLTGLTDIYEVVGRFSFQGEANKNLGQVQALVSGARNEIAAQRGRLADLLRLPEQARAAAARLGAEEEARASAESESKTAVFEPLAQQVSVRAEQTIAAMRAVPFPDLASAEAASDEYKRFIGKLEQVYQTCLPFLRKAIGNLYGFIACEPGASWPDALPLVREMPAELCTVPPADSSELGQARQSLKELAAESIQLGRARDEIATSMARLEGEIGAAQVKDKEFELEIGTAGQVVELVATMEQAEAARKALPVLEQLKAERVRAAGEVWQRHRKLEASIKMIEADLAARTEELEKLSEQLAAHKGDEPVLFGKDAWRARGADLEAQIEQRKALSATLVGSLNQLKIELSAISVQVQTEETQRGLVDRQVEGMQARLAALDKVIREMGAALGLARPARPVALAEAQEALGMLQQGRLSIGQLLSRQRDEVRAKKDEGLRILARLKQIGVERQHMQAMVESAEVAATQGREEALRQLAGQRRAAVELHVSEVLGNLEKSLAQVSLTFIEPAREALRKSVAPRADISAAVLESATAVAPVVEKLSQELDPQLLAQDAALGQLQREFCDVAVEACRVAWS